MSFLTDPVYAASRIGATYALRAGSSARIGFSWAGDPGPIYLTVSAGRIPSTLLRFDATRAMAFVPDSTYGAYETTEWITVTATSSSLPWIEDITLSYFYTVEATDQLGEHEEAIVPQRYHVIGFEGQIVGWVRAVPVAPGQPRPVIAPVVEGHTLHLDVAIAGETGDTTELAALLAAAIASE
jgi:hypothetical protein